MKHKVKIVLAIATICIGASIYFRNHRVFIQPTHTAIKKEILQNIPQLNETQSSADVAVFLRDHAYHITKIGSGSEPNPFTLQYYLDIKNQKHPLLCNGMAVLFVGMAQAFGIPARLISVASNGAVDGSKPFDTHVLAEVFVNDEWIAHDPTFNVSWLDENGKLLSGSDIYEILKAGRMITPTTNGMKTVPGRTIDSYYIPYSDLFENIEIAELDALNKGRTKVVTTKPAGYSWRYPAIVSSVPAPEKTHQTMSVLKDENKETMLNNWKFESNVETDNESLLIQTKPSNFAYEAFSPEFILEKGRYNVELDANIVRGGMVLGFLDMSNNTWIKSYHAHSSQYQGEFKKFFYQLDLDSEKEVQIIFSNWSYEFDYSVWQIRGLRIRR